MVETLLCAHIVLLVLLYRLLNGLAGRIVAIFYATYLAGFTVIKPILLYYFGLFFPYSTNAPGPVAASLVGTLIFLTIQCVGIGILGDLSPPKFVVRCFDFDRVQPRGVMFAFAVLMVISFVCCTIKFSSVAYIFTYTDAFAATMALANGSFFLNILAEILFYGFLMFAACTYWRFPPRRAFAYMALALILTFAWTKLANRTSILTAILAWVSCVMTRDQQRRLNIFALGILGYSLLFLLYAVNFLRLGNIEHFSLGAAVFDAVYGAAVDMSPVDNSVMAYAFLKPQDLTHFVYLMGAITPLVMMPSSLFPFKLRADKDAALTDIFFPQGADQAFYHEGSNLTFTIPASGYADGYYFGVIVASILYVVLFCLYLQVFRKGTRSARFIAAYYMMVMVAGYRLSIETLCVGFYLSLTFVGLTRFLALFPSVGGKTFSGSNEEFSSSGSHLASPP